MTIEQINNILIQQDPIGLISGGAPKDEYAREAEKIMVLLKTNYSVDELSEQLYKLFSESFGTDTAGSDKNKYRVLAAELVKSA